MRDNLDEIIAGCKAGDRLSQEKLYKTLSPEMYAVCLQYAENATEAKDFLQEGFISVFTKINSYRGEGSFEGWVRKIMVNTALQFLRKKKHMFLINEEITLDTDYELPVEQYEMENEDLLRMIQKLPVNQRMVFNLYAIEGYNHTEIANMAGIPENTSKSHLLRARTTLKEMIKTATLTKDHKLRKNV